MRCSSSCSVEAHLSVEELHGAPLINPTYTPDGSVIDYQEPGPDRDLDPYKPCNP